MVVEGIIPCCNPDWDLYFLTVYEGGGGNYHAVTRIVICKFTLTSREEDTATKQYYSHYAWGFERT